MNALILSATLLCALSLSSCMSDGTALVGVDAFGHKAAAREIEHSKLKQQAADAAGLTLAEWEAYDVERSTEFGQTGKTTETDRKWASRINRGQNSSRNATSSGTSRNSTADKNAEPEYIRQIPKVYARGAQTVVSPYSGRSFGVHEAQVIERRQGSSIVLDPTMPGRPINLFR